MRTIEQLRDEILMKFGNNVSLKPPEIDVILNFVIEEFSYDYPEFKGIVITPTNDNGKLYLNEIDDNLLEIKTAIYTSADASILYTLNSLRNYGVIEIRGNYFRKKFLHEQIALKLHNEYLENLFLNQKMFKPFVMSDTTGEYILINGEVIIFYTSRRFIDRDNIPEYLQKPLRYFAYIKFIDQLTSEDYKFKVEKMAEVFDMIQNQIADVTSAEDDRDIKSISLGQISISFGSKTEKNFKLLMDALKQINVTGDFKKFLEEKQKEYKNKYKMLKFSYYVSAI